MTGKRRGDAGLAAGAALPFGGEAARAPATEPRACATPGCGTRLRRSRPAGFPYCGACEERGAAAAPRVIVRREAGSR